MEIILIAGVDAQCFGIGYQNSLVYHDPLDKQYFRSITTSGKFNCVLMGNNTFKSIGHPLKNRLNIVLTRQSNLISSDVIYVNSYEEGINMAKQRGCDKLFIIGGEEIYSYALNCEYHSIILTLFPHQKGKAFDTFFPSIDNVQHRISIFSHGHLTIKKYIPIRNNDEENYLNLLKYIMEKGEYRKTRNANTISCFGYRLTFDLEKGFPLLTTKKVWFKGIVEELLWFLNGHTNVNILKNKGVHIWDGNTSREYLDSLNLPYQEGDAGPIYGFQWRHWNASYLGCDNDYTNQGFDQLAECVRLLKTDPMSRRILMSGWNVGQLKEMCLPPCHVLYQFYVSNNKLCCQMYQRSADCFLGLPFNIASVALLTHILAVYCGFQIGNIGIVLGDVHIYEEHLEQVKIQINRIPKPFPKFEMINIPDRIEDLSIKNFKINGYQTEERLTGKMIV